MEGETRSAPDLLRQVSAPIAVLVAVAVVLAWYVTWSTTDLTMSLTEPSMTAANPLALTVFLALLVVMMVAMMLPSALPMIVAYRGLTRLEAGRPVKPADDVATALFVLPYFLVWGAFAVVALFGLMALGLLGPFTGSLALVPAAILLAAGGWQLTRTKAVCLAHCQSPMGFVMHHWRSGRLGAVRMGLAHSVYCVGCCWLFMVVLFVVGAMNLVWMGVVSIAIFAEKVSAPGVPVSRVIGAILFVLGAVLAANALLVG